ncbi:tetraspanin-1-like [Gigantopelta aegis]|uniref:tetraspanin-1-like n=1 Tax=Gigantopelta aegis TaxID=1735272 RepID=UPI001B88A3EE|nr:tetraspanin-1-like [Gigantopelta aegis]
MGCFTSIGRILLIILNLLFLLMSLAILAVGVILKFFPGKIFSYILTAAKDFDLVKLPSGAEEINFLPLLDTVGVVLIVLGCILLSISFLACCGACCEWRLFLILFSILMLILILAQLLLGGLFLAKDSLLNKALKETLATEIKTRYKGPADRKDAFSMVVNMLSYSLECCGSRDYKDFDNTDWKLFKYPQNGTPQQTIIAAVTMTCCRKKYIDVDPPLLSCAKAPIDTSKIYNTGCYDKLYQLVDNKQLWVITVFVLLLLLQLPPGNYQYLFCRTFVRR